MEKSTMESRQEHRRLLFLPVDVRDPTRTTRRRTRSKSLDYKVRHHLMVNIGKSRRKPPKAPHFVTLEWSLAESTGLEAPSSVGQGEHSASQDVDHDHLHVPANDLVVPETADEYTTLSATTVPIIHALSVFEKEWGEDRFSAYGFALILVAGRNALCSTSSTNTFWFPFAFRQSAFLHHYQQIFTSPDVLIPLYRRSARELQALSLQRSLETIQCVESRISSSDAASATSDSVLHAVLALACYNFTSLDFDQAMIHVKGMWTVVRTRGGISTLEANHDLMLMVSWVDITAALIHDTKPLFPLPLSAPMARANEFQNSGLKTLPAPLLGVINNENEQNTQFINIISCIGHLNALAALVRLELATKGNAIWEDEDQMGFLINPVAHQLLHHPSRLEPATRWDIISEALRLGAIIWIIRVKRRCRSYPGSAEAHISSLLKILSSKFSSEDVWNSPELCLVRLWLLVLCSISEPREKDLTTSMDMIASGMKGSRSGLWVEIMAGIRQMPWVDIFEPGCSKLEQRLMKIRGETDLTAIGLELAVSHRRTRWTYLN
ncbi:hypothetical protein V8F33_009480 [Rhypophila sp. PSN 637]